MVGWHHQHNGHASEQTSGDSEQQGSLGAAVHGVINNQMGLTERDIQNLKELVTSRPALQELLKEILQAEGKYQKEILI